MVWIERRVPQFLLPPPVRSEAPPSPPASQPLDTVPPVLPPLAQSIANWTPQSTEGIDIDSFAVSVYPADLPKIFGPSSLVRLICHAPSFADLKHFDSWVYVAKAEALLRIHPQHKQRLVEQLRLPPHSLVIYPNEFPTSLTLGEPMVTLHALVEALEAIQCQSVRIQAYGMKAPLASFSNPVQYQPHPLQEANVYDVACTYPTNRITLLAPQTQSGQRTAVYKLYPCGLRVGQGYGGVEFKAVSRSDGILHFKAYSRMTHVLKAVSQLAGQAGQPMTIGVCKNRLHRLQAWKERMLPCPEADMLGIRLEVSVRALSLQHAVQVAHSSHLLDASFLFSEEAGPWQLCMHSFSKRELVTDLNTLTALAAEKEIFRGNSSKKSSILQRQVITDLYNALGWNPGRKPTEWNSASAWWEESATTLDVTSQLEQFANPVGARTLFAFVQARLPCYRCNRMGTYTLTGRRHFFRAECRTCHHALTAFKLRSHLASLITSQRTSIDLHALVVDLHTLTLLPIPQDLQMRPLSTRSNLLGLVRTQEFAAKEEPLLEALAHILLPDVSVAAPHRLKTMALDWLWENTESVEHHLGTRNQPTIERCLHSLQDGTASGHGEDILMLTGIAGALEVSIAYLVMGHKNWTCQVVPVGSHGPFHGLVLLSKGGYELFTSSHNPQ